MTPYQAILAAADHIETQPKAYDFGTYSYPACGTPGCALGWVAAIAKLPMDNRHYGCWNMRPITEFLGEDEDNFTEQRFYMRMDKLAPATREDVEGETVMVWTQEAGACAAALRQYAQKYHAPEQQPLESRSERTEEAVTND